MLCEFFDPQDYSFEMLNYYIPVMFTELMRVYQVDKNFEFARTGGKSSIIEILHYIEQHYRDCTLTTLAKAFSFNPNYLGNMLKERTGQTFVELVQMQRMIRAAAMLRKTGKTIDEISCKVGYENLGYFYRTFKKHFGVTPNRYRKGL